jgi:hypothetical protein
MPTSKTLTVKPVTNSDALEIQSYRSSKTSRMNGVIVEKHKRQSAYYTSTRRLFDLLEKEIESCNIATD